jgi:elongation factor G
VLSGSRRRRNIGIVAHVDAGKTTLSERILHCTGVSSRLGEVDNGTATMDWMPQEQERGISITAAVTTVHWTPAAGGPPCQINLVDTPGHVDFTVEVERTLRVLDGVVVVVCGIAGVEPQTETVWLQAARHALPRVVFVNKLDRPGADFERAISSVRERLGANVVPLQLPVSLPGNPFAGLVDLVGMRLLSWPGTHRGRACRSEPVPEALRPQALRLRDMLVAAAAEASDELTETYLSTGHLDEPRIRLGLRQRVLRNDVVLALGGSALGNQGVEPVLDAVIDYLPAPEDAPPMRATDAAGQESRCTVDAAGPLASFVFKIARDSDGSSLAYVRVQSGVLRAGDVVHNVRSGRRERVMELVRMHANQQSPLCEVDAGDIAAVKGLRDVVTGDSLCDEAHCLHFAPIEVPAPVLAVALEARVPADAAALVAALDVLARDDPSLQQRCEAETGRPLLAGMGELHLEVAVERVRREFGLDVVAGRPQVAYRETISGRAERVAHDDLVDAGGSRSRIGLRVRVEPTGVAAATPVIRGVRTGWWGARADVAEALQAGIAEVLGAGGPGGYPWGGLVVQVLDLTGAMPATPPPAFPLVVASAVRGALRAAGPCTCEPIMEIVVTVPAADVGDVLGDLSRRHATVGSLDGAGAVRRVCARVALARMLDYATALRSLTQGRGTFVMQLLDYAAVAGATHGERR